MSETAHDQFHRAALPEVLFLLDLAIALRLPEERVEELVLAGELGPHFRIAGRLAIRRDAFLTALAARERHVIPPIDDDVDPAKGVQ